MVKRLVILRLKKWALGTATTWDNFIIEMVEKSLLPLCYISTFYFALRTLHFTPTVNNVLHIAYLFAFTFFVLKITSAAGSTFGWPIIYCMII